MPPENPDTPPYAYLMLEGRAVYELGSMMLSLPWLLEGPKGDGHPVLVLPGFVSSGASTLPIRRFLRRMGYNALCWDQGRNLGDRQQLEKSALRRLQQIADRHGRKVSLVGWSLGGVYSRWLANTAPECVRSLITIASPFTGHPKANHFWRLYELLSGQAIDEIDEETFAAVRKTPPLPTTAIFSRSDGVTSWRCCVTEESELSENIEIGGSHFGLGVNPLTMHVIADRLAEPEGQWTRFERRGMRRFFFRRPGSLS